MSEHRVDRRHRAGVAAAAAVALLLAGCGAAADKVGGETVVLKFATIDGDVDPEGRVVAPQQVFMDSLEELSDGRVRVEVSTSYGDGAADVEVALVEAIASGEIDGGWPATRAFPRAGVPGLGPVESPLALTSYDAVNALVGGPAAETALAQLEGSGIVGLGLAAGELRRPFAAVGPLLGPDDWSGIRFRAFASPVQAAAISALGAKPAYVSFAWRDEIQAGSLRGAELGLAIARSLGSADVAPWVTANVVLWPKVMVFSMNETRFGALSSEQQAWVLEAAARATRASIEADWDESAIAAGLCAAGARFIDADAAQLDAVRAAVAPVVDDLAADPVTSGLTAEIQSIAEQYPDPEILDVPDECRQIDPPPVARQADPDGRSGFPDGTYRVELTADDIEDAGLSNGPGWTGTWTLEVEDGTYVLTCRPIQNQARDCGNSGGNGGAALEAGQLRGTASTVTLVYDVELISELTGCSLPVVSNDPESCFSIAPYSMSFVIDGDVVTFADPVGSGPELFVTEPWTKIR